MEDSGFGLSFTDSITHMLSYKEPSPRSFMAQVQANFSQFLLSISLMFNL